MAAQGIHAAESLSCREQPQFLQGQALPPRQRGVGRSRGLAALLHMEQAGSTGGGTATLDPPAGLRAASASVTLQIHTSRQHQHPAAL